MTNSNNTANPITIAIALSRALCHKCAPAEGGSYSSVEELHEAMMESANIANSGSPNRFGPQARAWDMERDGSLTWVTYSGRMFIRLTVEALELGLYSPSYRGGNHPYATARFGEHEDEISIADDAVELVKEKLSRLNLLWREVATAVGEDRVFDGCCNRDLRLIAGSAIASASEWSEEYYEEGEEIVSRMFERLEKASREAEPEEVKPPSLTASLGDALRSKGVSLTL